MHEHFFTCPYCWESISMLLDLSEPEPDYVEDCEICCNPIRIHYRVEEAELIFFEAEQLGQ